MKELTVVWFQGAGCTGCSVSLMNTQNPRIKELLLDEVVPGKKIALKFHPTLMAGQGKMAIKILEHVGEVEKNKYVLVVEGAIPTAGKGVYGRIGEETILSKFLELAKDANLIIAIGTCATYGGIPSGKPNPTGAKGCKEILEERGIEKTVINIPGCPPHPDWFVGTVLELLSGRVPELDEEGRPKLFYGKLIHENCPRRADFDKGKFATRFGEEGCLYELGCKGPTANADCPLRGWNNGISWCIQVGSPCIACQEPEFPDEVSPLYKKIRWEEENEDSD